MGAETASPTVEDWREHCRELARRERDEHAAADALAEAAGAVTAA
jgi:hypothetical protein